MRWIGITAAVLVLVAGFVWFGVPEILGIAINLTCGQPISENCQARGRALGDLYAMQGRIERGLLWFAWSGAAGDRISMFNAGWAENLLAMSELRESAKAAANGDGTLLVPDHFGPHAVAAAAWYTQATDAGFAPAMNNLGEMYRDGFGVDENHPRAFRLHMAAAKAGNPAGRINVSNDYRAGMGTPVDMRAAQQWWTPDLKETNAADLVEPTFGRTLVGNKLIDPRERALIRDQAAKERAQKPESGSSPAAN